MMSRFINIYVTPEDLIAFAWSAPMRELAARVAMSDVGLRKLLRGHGIVTPPRGHWNRARAGRSLRGPPPPRPRPAGGSGRVRLDDRFRGIVRDVGGWPVDGPFATPLVPESLEELRDLILNSTRHVKVHSLSKQAHRGVLRLLRAEVERKEKHAAGGWLAEAPRFSAAFWQRQVKLCNALFLALDQHGATGSLDDRNGQLAVLVRVGSTFVPLRLEPVERYRRERLAGVERAASDLPVSTPLQLVIGTEEAGYAMYREGGSSARLEGRLRDVVADVVTSGEARFRRGLRDHRDWLIRASAAEEEARQRRFSARAARLAELAAALREADEIRTSVARAGGSC